MQTAQVYNKMVAITLSDTINIPEIRPTDAIYVGTKGATGTMVAVLQNGVTATFVGIAAGSILPIKAIRVNNTTTDVSNLLALYSV